MSDGDSTTPKPKRTLTDLDVVIERKGTAPTITTVKGGTAPRPGNLNVSPGKSGGGAPPTDHDS